MTRKGTPADPQAVKQLYSGDYHEVLAKLIQVHHTPILVADEQHWRVPPKKVNQKSTLVPVHPQTELEAFDEAALSQIITEGLKVSRELKQLYDLVFEKMEERRQLINQKHGTSDMPLTGTVTSPSGLTVLLHQNTQISLNKNDYSIATTLVKEALSEVDAPLITTVLKLINTKPSNESLANLKLAIGDISKKIENGSIQLNEAQLVKFNNAQELIIKENKRIYGRVIPYLFVSGVDGKKVRILLNLSDFALAADELFQNNAELPDEKNADAAQAETTQTESTLQGE